MKNRQIRIIAVLLATVLAYAGLIGAAAVTAQAADNAPVVQPVTAQTCVDIAVEAELSATDADNDVVLYQLTEKPRLGTAKIEGSTLYYAPGRKAGRDSFHYTAVDAEGNTAQPAAITIEIKKNKTGLTYSDMDGDPAHYAAIYLSQKGVMTGETIGSCAFFHPNRPVTRSEFIAQPPRQTCPLNRQTRPTLRMTADFPRGPSRISAPQPQTDWSAATRPSPA